MAEQEDDDAEPVRYTVLSHRAIAVWAVLIVATGVGVAVWLLLAYRAGDPRVQLDAIRTAGTVVVGAGGAAALLLAARRQRTAEIALKQKDRDQADVARAHALQERVAAETRAHQERVAAATEHDAAQRRVTELYTAAAAQLGSDKAPVRLAGLYALERLAQDNPPQRQTIVNVLCAYLRMPYTLPEDLSNDHADQDRAIARAVHTERVQEREVRLTAQRVLATHLSPGDGATPADSFWANTDIDLTSAVLIDFSLADCHVHRAQFIHAKFADYVTFDGTQFVSYAMFDGAQFTDLVSFDGARFFKYTTFDKARFANYASFKGVQFADYTTFDQAKFADYASFDGVQFAGGALFDGVQFAGHASFDEVQFAGHASFDEVQFADYTTFNGTQFAGHASFDEVQFADYTTFNAAKFASHTTFDEAKFDGETSFGEAKTSSGTSFSDDTSFKAVVFARGVPTVVERFWSPPPQAGDAADPEEDFADPWADLESEPNGRPD